MLSQLLNTAPSKKKNQTYPCDHMDAKLRFSELRYRRLFETAQDGILILNAETGKITDANPFLKKILGYSQEDLLGKELWQIGVFKDIKDSKAAFLELQKNGYIRYKDLPLETKTGHSIDVEFVSNVYMVDQQKVIQCNIRDISDRKKAEDIVTSKTKDLEELTRSQEETKQAMLNVMEDLEDAKTRIEIEKVKDEAMFASMGEGLIAVDNSAKVTAVNKAAEEMLGWKSKDLIGKVVTTLPLEDEEGNPVPLEKRPSFLALATGKITNMTYFFVRKDHVKFPIAVNVTPLVLGGKTIGLIETFRDITREKEIDRAKTEFVSLASHQLRTPLGIAKWYIEAIREEGYFDKVPEIGKDYFNEVYKSNERLLALVRNLLSISRIDQGKVKDTPKLTNIIELVGDAVKSMSIVAAKSKITIHLTIEKTIPGLFIDPLRVQEVIENLITNAIEYSSTASQIEVVVDKLPQKILIIVKDTGIGISEKDKKKLFTKFFRSEKASVKNAEGTGLGLYVVKSYVEGWGGDISLVSKEGKGSTFTISLPITKQENRGVGTRF